MAAIGASGGEGSAQQAQGAQQGEGHEAAQTGPDVTQLAEQLSGVGSSLEEMRQFLASQPWQQQAAAEGEGDGEGGYDVDLSFLETETDPNVAAQRLNQVIESVVDQRAKALVEPLHKRTEEMRLQREAERLADTFPELGDIEAAKRLAGPGGLVEQQLQEAHASPEVARVLAAEPWFWGLVHAASKVHDIANNSESDDSAAASLESGGGAGPAQVSEADLVKQIANAGPRGSRVLDFG